jgi:hypothetical protein
VIILPLLDCESSRIGWSLGAMFLQYTQLPFLSRTREGVGARSLWYTGGLTEALKLLTHRLYYRLCHSLYGVILSAINFLKCYKVFCDISFVTFTIEVVISALRSSSVFVLWLCKLDSQIAPNKKVQSIKSGEWGGHNILFIQLGNLRSVLGSVIKLKNRTSLWRMRLLLLLFLT